MEFIILNLFFWPIMTFCWAIYYYTAIAVQSYYNKQEQIWKK